MWKCRFCNQEFDLVRTTDKGNHAKHCEKNPSRLSSYKKVKEAQAKRIIQKLGVYKKFAVVCEVCKKTFTVKEREFQHPKKAHYFCSRICSNSIGGKAKSEKYHYDEVATYTTVAWRHHERKCVVCGESNIVAVHHLNEIHDDNDPKNLIPLCPTHHHYMHSKHKILIQDQIDKYIQIKWG